MVAAIAAAYQIVALIAASVPLGRRRARVTPGKLYPFVSILKPVRGSDPGFLRSHPFERRAGLPALRDSDRRVRIRRCRDPVIERVAREFPSDRFALIGGLPSTPNGKAGKLAQLAAEARGECW